MADDLHRTQRWMQDAIVREEATLDASHVVAGSAGLSADQRLELYRRGYRSRLVGCLRETYPALRHALGDEVFDAFALDYLHAHPSRSYTLTRLGAGWPEHLEATRPDRDAPERERWPDFLIDLARLERTFQEVYDAAGVEGRALPRSHDLATEPSPHATVEPVPCLRPLAARFPVAAYLGAVRRGEQPPLPSPARSFFAVSRRDWVVTLTELGEREHAALQALLSGGDMSDAAQASGLGEGTTWACIRAWADRGFLLAVREREPVLLSTNGVAR